MYLQCPRCHSVFEINPQTLGAKGRKVNCAVCSNVWLAKASALLAKMPALAKTEKVAFAEEPSRASAFSPPPPAADSIAPPAPSSSQRQSQKATTQSKGEGKDKGRDENRGQAAIPPPHIASPIQQATPPYQPKGAAAAIYAQTHHLHFAPLRFAERNIERRLNELLSFAISWAVWGVFVAAIIYTVHTYPIEIITRFPNAIHLYERLNLKQPAFSKFMLPTKSYSIGKVEVTSEFRLSRDILLITTSVANETQEPIDTPIMRGSFRNAIDEEISYFHFRASEGQIPADKTIEYRINVGKPDSASETLLITLLSPFEASLDIGENRLRAKAATEIQNLKNTTEENTTEENTTEKPELEN